MVNKKTKNRKRKPLQFKIRQTKYPIYDETLRKGYDYNPFMQIPVSENISKKLDVQPSYIPKGPKTYQPPTTEPQPPGDKPTGDNKPDIEGLIDLLKPEDLSKVKNALELYCKLYPAKCANKYKKTDKTKGLDPKVHKDKPPTANTSQETLPKYTSTTEPVTEPAPPYQEPVSQTPNYSTPDISMQSLNQIMEGPLPWEGLPLTQAPLTTSFLSGFSSWLVSTGGAIVGLTTTVVNVFVEVMRQGGEFFKNLFKCFFDPDACIMGEANFSTTKKKPLDKPKAFYPPPTPDYTPDVY